ncbi:hypothetical protein D3C80_2024450 [compost metagenome]
MGGSTQWPGVIEHALGDVKGDTLPRRKTLTQSATEIPGAAAQVQPATGDKITRQATQQLTAHITLQLGHAVVARRCARKGGCHLALVGQTAGQVRKG